MLAVNEAASVAAIEGSTDATVLGNVKKVVDILAGNDV
jgi:hypothetical protein